MKSPITVTNTLSNGFFNLMCDKPPVDLDCMLYVEYAADLLALEVITPTDYFKAKRMLKSTDQEVVALGKTFLDTKNVQR